MFSITLFISSVILAAHCQDETCRKFLTHRYYEELNCEPVFENRDTCPTRYDCQNHENRDNTKCYYKGVAYGVGSIIPDEVADPCSAQCRCIQMGGEKPYFVCANVECPELFMGPLKDPNCHRLYSSKTCCSTSTYCKDKEPERYTCRVDNKIYYEGQKFYPEGEPCIVCLCKRGFIGDLLEPFCHEVSCGVLLHSGQNINDNCAPVYYEEKGCCPIEWICPSEKEFTVTKSTKENPEARTTEQCSFGDLKLNIDDSLDTDDTTVDCKCSIPPYLTCIKSYKKS